MGGPEKPSSPVEEGSKRSASRANDEDEDGQILKSQGWPETTDHSNSKHIPQTCLKTCFFLNKNFNVSCDDTFIYVPGSRHIHICTWKYFGFVSCLQVRKRAVHAIGNCWTIFLGCTCIMVGYTSYSIVLMGCPPKLDLANPMDDHSRRFLMAYKRGHLRFLKKSMPHSC